MRRSVLIVGLGNIGSAYEHTSHNIGFHAVDALARVLHLRFERQKSVHAAVSATASVEEGRLILAKPQQYMNRSGYAVSALCRWYAISPDRCIVVVDNVDLPAGKMRLKKRGTSRATHNGVRSIEEQLGTSDFARYYIGVGGEKRENEPLTEYLLKKWTKNQKQIYEAACESTAHVLKHAVQDDFDTLIEITRALQTNIP